MIALNKLIGINANPAKLARSSVPFDLVIATLSRGVVCIDDDAAKVALLFGKRLHMEEPFREPNAIVEAEVCFACHEDMITRSKRMLKKSKEKISHFLGCLDSIDTPGMRLCLAYLLGGDTCIGNGHMVFDLSEQDNAVLHTVLIGEDAGSNARGRNLGN